MYDLKLVIVIVHQTLAGFEGKRDNTPERVEFCFLKRIRSLNSRFLFDLNRIDSNCKCSFIYVTKFDIYY
jgi:hypothetical protein